MNDQDLLETELELASPAHQLTASPAGDCQTVRAESPGIERLRNHARALRLESALKLRTSIDDTGRLGDSVEIVYERLREPHGALLAVAVRVGRSTCDDDLRAQGGILPKFRRYNAALARLRLLAERLADLPNDRATLLMADGQCGGAYRTLQQLDVAIDRRQSAYMAGNVVRLATLVKEIAYLERCDEQITRVIVGAEIAPRLSELSVDDVLGLPPPPTSPSTQPPIPRPNRAPTPQPLPAPTTRQSSVPTPAAHPLARPTAPPPNPESVTTPSPPPPAASPPAPNPAPTSAPQPPLRSAPRPARARGHGWMAGIMERVPRAK